MHLTLESEYALLALQHLADAGTEAPVAVATIAEAGGLPQQFLAKILQKLGRAGLLVGGRGRGRGYQLARSAERISIREVLAAVEPGERLESCLLWQGYCGDANPCPLHHRLKPMHRQIRELVSDLSLAAYINESKHRQIRDADVPARVSARR